MEAEKIAELNDELRTTLITGEIILTSGVNASEDKEFIIEAVRKFEFNGVDDNNPYGENDFGKITINGTDYFFKIDYYDKALKFGSEDPANVEITRRVLTIMRADEY